MYDIAGPIAIAVTLVLVVGLMCIGIMDGFDRSLEQRCTHTCIDVNRALVSSYDDENGLCTCRNGSVYVIRSTVDVVRQVPVP
jgi:hypothetical protein